MVAWLHNGYTLSFTGSRSLRIWLAVLIGLAGATRAAQAQGALTGAAIAGTVRDASGAPVPQATVTATDGATRLAHTTMTDAGGRYVLAALPLGSYVFRVERRGFQAATRTDVSPGVGELLVVDLTLDVAAIETVSVHREMAGSLAGGALTSILGARALADLPTNGRDFIAFTLVTPAVVAERAPPSGLSPSSGLSFAGQRARSNNVMVDGFDNNQPFTGSVAATFSQDAIREFQVLAVSYPAEFGGASGGIVNTVTRSGTNQFHGGAFLFLRDDALNAKEYFEGHDVFGNRRESPKAPFRQAQWGATLGGPVRADRTFFFLSYEQLDVDATNFVTIDPAVADALRSNGFPVDLGSVPYAIGTRSALAKIDHAFGSGHRLLVRGHFSRDVDENIEPFGGIVARSHGLVQRRTDWGVAVAQTDVFSSHLVSEARLQMTSGAWAIQSLDPTCAGPCVGLAQGGPEVSVAGVALAGRQFNSPSPGSNLTLQLAETVTRAAGRHTLKAGLDFRLIHREQLVAQDMGGRYLFAALPAIPGLLPRPLTALEAFQQGIPAVYLQGYGDPTSAGSSRMGAVFAQDRWQVAGKLTVEAGLRYQRYALGTPTRTVSAPAGTTLTFDIPGSGDLAPRLAVAFDPAGHGRTSLHAAFGLFHEYPPLAVATVTEIHDGVDLLSLRTSLPLSAQAWRSPGHRLPQPRSFPSQVFTAGPGFRVPFARHLSIGVDQQLPGAVKLDVDLLWVRGERQIGPIDFNPLVPSLGRDRRPDDVASQAGTSASLLQLTNYGQSWYRGLTVRLQKRTPHWEAAAAYTLSKADDLGSDMFGPLQFAEDAGLGRDPADPTGLPLGFDADEFRGPAAVDQRHRLVLSLILDLPWSIRLSGLGTFASGRPYTALAGADLNGDGLPTNDRARRDPLDAQSRVGRNEGLTPGIASIDARVSRRFALSPRVGLEILAEAFNVLDRANFSEVNAVFGPKAFPGDPQLDPQGHTTFGRPTKVYPPRQLQLAARLSF